LWKFAACGSASDGLLESARIGYVLNVQKSSAIAALSALATETRLHAVQLVAASGPDGLPAGEIARRLDVPQNTLSGHLAILTRAGILTAQRKSRFIIYKANVQAIQNLISFLDRSFSDSSTDVRIAVREDPTRTKEKQALKAPATS